MPHATDMDQVREFFEQQAAKRAYFRPAADNEYTIRIAPPVEGGLFFFPYGIHYDCQYLAEAFVDHAATICLRLTLDQDCPVCHRVRHLRFTAQREKPINKELVDLTWRMRATERFVCNIFVEGQEKVLLWAYGKQVNEQLGPLFRRWKDITHPEHGRWLSATYGKKGQWTVLTSLQVLPEAGPIAVKEWPQKLHNLREVIKGDVIPAVTLKEWLGDPDAVPSLAVERSAVADDHVPTPVDDYPWTDDANEDAAPAAAAAGDDLEELDITDDKVQKLLVALAKASKAR